MEKGTPAVGVIVVSLLWWRLRFCPLQGLEAAAEQLRHKMVSFPTSSESKAAEVKDIVMKQYSPAPLSQEASPEAAQPTSSPGVRRFAARKNEWQKYSKPGTRQSWSGGSQSDADH